jgi:hypothetical protein
MPAAALSDRYVLGTRCQRDRLRMYECVVEHDIGAPEEARRAQRQEIRRPWTGSYEVHGPGRASLSAFDHRIIPAATVPLVASSMRTKLPVARFSS